jgi:cholesterol oxidase
MEQFDAIIVGSGFGGAVMAYHLAEAGLRVCVLERGKAYPPGAFPRQPAAMQQNFWEPHAGYFGLFNVWNFEHMTAVSASGVGGGSLIYANVLIRRPEEWFAEQRWPVRYAELAPHYEAVETMLGAEHYPFAFPPFSRTEKTGLFQQAARAGGHNADLPLLAVNFRPHPGADPLVNAPLADSSLPSFHQRDGYANTRLTCKLCGECNVGCNYGSKNSLDYTYLRHAEQLGAEIRPLSEVVRFRPVAQGYEVTYRRHNPAWGGRARPTERTMLAKQLVLAAGSLGSSYLLLKMQQREAAFRHLSPTLGSRFSGNGDYLAFVRQHPEALARNDKPLLNADVGPVITSSVQLNWTDADGTTRSCFIQDGGLPAFANWLMEALNMDSAMRAASLLAKLGMRGLTDSFDSNLSAEVASLFGDRMARTMPLLGMGLDTPNGQMYLRACDDGRLLLDLDWTPAQSEHYFDAVETQMESLAAAMGGELVQNGLTKYLGRAVTSHPLGGCPMGHSAADGVVNSYGEVFGFPGLFVADGAVMPGPIGPNPSLTIAALASRFAEKVIANHRA